MRQYIFDWGNIIVFTLAEIVSALKVGLMAKRGGNGTLQRTTSLVAGCSFPPNCRHLGWPTRIYPMRESPQRLLYKIKYTTSSV